MFRVITANTNGIRSAAKKGFFTWLETQHADVVCIQETKAQRDQLDDALFHPQGYHCYYFDAEKKGYSGTALYAKQKPDQVITGLGWASADTEGRYLQADFGKLSVVSLYLPSGSSSEQAQQKKFDFLACYLPVLKEQINSGRDFILCGDWNIAHKPIDLKNWKSNQKNSGFLPEERAWLDTLFDEVGFVDAFRVINQEENQFTWWSNRGAAWEKNVGWRIDYQIVTPALRNTVQRVEIYKAERFSDHAPLIMDYLL
ncbi:MAG: exodeoxyribonuclease III [Cellvibrionales bacterium]|nr:exodeoxyribonuclease III [Cellvibrionales bacterium]